MDFINTEKLILASKSPRRNDLLRQIGIQVNILPSNIDEQALLFTNPEEYVRELSFLKADHVAQSYPDSWILGADTIVIAGSQILGKPRSKNEAIEMLNQLNDRDHLVYTGFCVMNREKTALIQDCVKTRVRFKHLSRREILWYVETGEPFDKAGGYGIQGIGAFLVKEIAGSYSNVVGLPVCEVVETLQTLNIIQFKDHYHHALH
jgi:septum formation protein